jgi:hypothetical protein
MIFFNSSKDVTYNREAMKNEICMFGREISDFAYKDDLLVNFEYTGCLFLFPSMLT